MYYADAKYRYLSKYDAESMTEQNKLFAEHKTEVRQLDSENRRRLMYILDNYGFLSARQVGITATQGLFSTLQHSGYATQKKYEPLIDSAFKVKAIVPGEYALFKDRIALFEKTPQVYGTQIVYSKMLKSSVVYPLKYPERVQQLRDSLGIKYNPFVQYVALWKIKWDLSGYLKSLPELDKEFNVVR